MSKVISFRITDEEYEELKKKLNGENITVYMRKQLVNSINNKMLGIYRDYSDSLRNLMIRIARKQGITLSLTFKCPNCGSNVLATKFDIEDTDEGLKIEAMKGYCLNCLGK